MKADINENGSLIVITETQLETFALSKWYEENINGCTRQFKDERPDCFYIVANYKYKKTIKERVQLWLLNHGLIK